jgi:hypothetical protein
MGQEEGTEMQWILKMNIQAGGKVVEEGVVVTHTAAVRRSRA